MTVTSRWSSSRTALRTFLPFVSLTPVSIRMIASSLPRIAPTLTPPGTAKTRSLSCVSTLETSNVNPSADSGHDILFRQSMPHEEKSVTIRHVVEVAQFDRPWLEALFDRADV